MDDDDPFGSYGLRPIRIEDKPVFDQCLSFCRTRLSDYTFANTFIWRNPIHLRWALIRDCLCVFANGDGGLTMLFPPLGDGDVTETLRACLTICDDYNADARLDNWTRVEYVSAEVLRKLPGDFLVEPMSGDYVYPTARMIDLAGGDLASKRQARNRFARRYQARTEPFDPAVHLTLCTGMLHRWRQQIEENAADCGRSSVAVKRSKDVAAASEAMANFHSLGLKGMVLYADDRMVGFTLGEMLDDKSCSIMIEKADRDYAGSAQYIFSEFCRQYWSHAEWCNVGDDWDVPSLAWTKQSYRPAYRLEKWVMRPVQAASIPAPRVVQSGELVKDTPEEAKTSFELNRADLSDLDALMALENKNFTTPVALSRRQLRYLMKSPSASVHVLRCGGKLVGDALLLRRRRKDCITGRLYSLAVDSAHRGKGFGKALLNNCLDILKAEGIATVFLEVDVENIPAIALYEAFGFKKIRRMADYYAPGKDGWKMQLKVPAERSAAWLSPSHAGVEVAVAAGQH